MAKPARPAAKRGRPAKPAKRRRPAKPATRGRPASKKGWRAWRVVPQADGPHGRLGVLWAVATALIVLLGALPAGAWMALHAALAVVQVERSWGSDSRTTLASAVGSGLFAFACGFGLIGAGVGLALAASTSAVSTAGKGQVRPRTILTAVLVGAAAGSIPLARTIGPMPGVLLLGLLCAHDTGNYVVGTGAHNAWEGTAAGIAATVPVTVMGATLAVPPFTEPGAWILGALAVPLAPLGPFAGSALLGPAKKPRVPALRRLDGLLLLGPAWVVAAQFVRS